MFQTLKKLAFCLSFVILGACGSENGADRAPYEHPEATIEMPDFDQAAMRRAPSCESRCALKKVDCESRGYSFCQSTYDLCSSTCNI